MKTRWYKDSVFYQIYPRSFCDGNGDGIGDIRGIISKLDYLKDLGVTAVWLSPVYESPNDDNGYDISDYKKIMPDFGTMDDFKEMVSGMHKRGIKLVMDLVVNHSSDEHFWFSESRKSVDNPYRDYYIWRKGRGKNGKKPPNNWTSRFTGSAWSYDEQTKEWYLHLFSKKQPDLNWDNPKVRNEVADICNFWLELGIDGFRCDVITYISKKEGLPNGKFHLIMRGDEHFVMGPHIHEYLKEINQKSWSRYDTMIVGEAIGTNVKSAATLIFEDAHELDSAITFELMDVDMKMNFYPVKLNLRKFKKVLETWQKLPMNCTPTLYIENHDQPRCVSRYGRDGKNYDKLSKMLATMLFFQRGIPYIYQGQEIGMTNIALKQEEYIDIMAVQIFTMIKKLFPPLMPLARKIMAIRARDHARTPMQWSGSENAGFSTAKPWMKVNPNYTDINVENQINDPNSVYSYYKKIIRLRLHNDLVINGEFEQLEPKNKNLFIYMRKSDKKNYLVVCNFKNKTVKHTLKSNSLNFRCDYRLLISNYDNTPEKFTGTLELLPYQAMVYESDG